MMLREVLGLNNYCMISLVGAGGKSTLMYTLAEELRHENKCLVTTTTKIYVPEKEKYDFIGVGYKDLNIFKDSSVNGVYVYGNSINEEKKLIGIRSEELEGQLSYFDYILVEADGSKRKSLKGWNSLEPVICKDTQMTIGVLSIECIGKEINEFNVHRVNEFIDITHSRENDIISEEHIVSLIFHPRGLFKNSLGAKILFINKIENNDQANVVKKVLESIKVENNKKILIDRIIIGSLRNQYYEQV